MDAMRRTGTEPEAISGQNGGQRTNLCPPDTPEDQRGETEDDYFPTLKNPDSARSRRMAAQALGLVQQHAGCPDDLVYVLAAERTKVVKIGLSKRVNFRDRLGDIQSCSPVKLAVALKVPGGRNLEIALHLLFAKYRQHGEWFEYTLPIRMFVRRAQKCAIRNEVTMEDMLATHLRIGRDRAKTLIRAYNAAFTRPSPVTEK